MILNIIHLPSRIDRMHLLQDEINYNQITEYKMWNGIIDPNLACRGISKAHKQIVRFAMDNNLQEVLIAEDDFHFTSDFAFKFFIQNKPCDYDVYLGSIYHGTLKADNTTDDFSGLTFYLVNQRFYQEFLSISELIHLDRGLRNKGKYVVCNPFAVIQHNGFSDNVGQNCDYTQYLNGRDLLE